MNVQLPMMTQILIGISDTFARYWWLMLGFLIALIILGKRFQSTEEGRRKIDHWKMNAPVLGRVVKLNLFGQFARTLSTLLASGVDFVVLQTENGPQNLFGMFAQQR